jgi:hypothetical protein
MQWMQFISMNSSTRNLFSESGARGSTEHDPEAKRSGWSTESPCEDRIVEQRESGESPAGSESQGAPTLNRRRRCSRPRRRRTGPAIGFDRALEDEAHPPGQGELRLPQADRIGFGSRTTPLSSSTPT